MFCSNCGKEIDDKAVICVHCGCAVKDLTAINNKKKSGLTALLLCFFLGCLGIHNFYAGRTGAGVGQLILTILCFTIPISMIWAFVDFIIIICGSFTDQYGNKLEL